MTESNAFSRKQAVVVESWKDAYNPELRLVKASFQEGEKHAYPGQRDVSVHVTDAAACHHCERT